MLALAFATLLVTQAPSTRVAEVAECYDGDTCTVSFDLGFDLVLARQRIRLCDVDAPELRPLTTRDAGTKARDALRKWLAEAKVIGVITYGKDVFGRWLVHLYADGVLLNQRLIDEKLAEPYARKCGTPND